MTQTKFSHNPGLLALRSRVDWVRNVPVIREVMPTMVTPSRAREIHASMTFTDAEAAYIDSVVDQHPGGIGWVDALLMIAESETQTP
jgi:hypothetical protein